MRMNDTPLQRGSFEQTRYFAPALFGAVSAVAGIAEAGKDEAVFVEAVIDGGSPDRHVGMCAAQSFDAFG